MSTGHAEDEGNINMRMKRFAIGLLVMLSAFVLAVGNADAAKPKPVEFVPADVSVTAWECALGDFCAWTGLNGTGSRCSWTNADPDWLAGTIRCSWAGTSRVQSYRNNGTSSSFTGVEIYQNANYVTKFHCAPQGGSLWNVTEGGVFLRSHRWISSPCF